MAARQHARRRQLGISFIIVAIPILVGAFFASPAGAANPNMHTYTFTFGTGDVVSGQVAQGDVTVTVAGQVLTLHLSCSDTFLGPDKVVGGDDDGYSSVGHDPDFDNPDHHDPDLRVVDYYILWEQDGEFFKECPPGGGTTTTSSTSTSTSTSSTSTSTSSTSTSSTSTSTSTSSTSTSTTVLATTTTAAPTTTSTAAGAVVLPTIVVEETTTTAPPVVDATVVETTVPVSVLGRTIVKGGDLARTGAETRTLLFMAGIVLGLGGLALLFGETAPAATDRGRH